MATALYPVPPVTVNLFAEDSPVSVERETGARYPDSSGYSSERTPKVKSKFMRPAQTSRTDVSNPSSSMAETGSPPIHVHFQQHPLTGQIEPAESVRRPRPLLGTLKRIRGLDQATRKQLTDADDLLCKGKYAEAIPCLETGLIGSNKHPHLQMLIWMQLGNAHIILGQYKKASVCHMHFLAFCRERKNFQGMTQAECNLGIAYMKLGLLKLAGRCFLQYLENSQQLKDDTSTASAYSNLGTLSNILAVRSYQSAMKEGDKARARETLRTNLRRSIAYFEHHLEIVEEYGDFEKQGRAYSNLGSSYEMLREFPQAIFCHNKRLEISRTIGNRESECCALCNLGNCFRATGKLQESLEYYLLNLELSRATGNVSGESVSLLNLGTTCELLNHLDKAIEWHTLYLSIMVQTKNLKGQARAFSTLAGIYEETKQLTKAHEYYKKLVDVFQQLGDRDAHSAASQYLEEVKRSMQVQKLHQEKIKKKRKHKKKKTKGTPHTISKATAIQTLPKRSRVTRNKISTWSPARGQWYQTNPDSVMSFSSSLVFENPATTSQEFLTMASQPDKVYRSRSVSQSLFEHETSVAEHHPFYMLQEVMSESSERSLPPILGESSERNEGSGDESITDYESVEGEQHTASHFLGSHRHRQELQRMGRDFTQPVSELGLEGADKEWIQWLQIQEATDNDALSRVGSLNIDMSLFDRSIAMATSASAPTALDRLEEGKQDGSRR